MIMITATVQRVKKTSFYRVTFGGAIPLGQSTLNTDIETELIYEFTSKIRVI